MRRLLPLFILASCLLLALGQSMSEKPRPPGEVVAGSSPQVLRGAEVYDLVCSDCHGDSGMGIAEGRLSFLPDHQRCEGCHKPFNAPTKANVELSERNSFNIGEPPPLRGDGVLAHFGNASVLYSYLQATMPRYDPGILSDEDYLDITAFLLELNGALPDDATLTEENAPALTTSP